MSQDLAEKAEIAIQKILCELEIGTGCIVESIYLKDIDMTGVNDDRVQLLRSIRIELKANPGTRWSGI